VGPRKGIEESVTLCVDLKAALLGECSAEKASVFGQCVGVALAEGVEQAGGSLNVRADEADRPCR
jgi:hypothetical protein